MSTGRHFLSSFLFTASLFLVLAGLFSPAITAASYFALACFSWLAWQEVRR
jgi:hypothetical protein